MCIHAPVAQPVEQIPFKDKVVGSIPTGRTMSSIKTVNHTLLFLLIFTIVSSIVAYNIAMKAYDTVFEISSNRYDTLN